MNCRDYIKYDGWRLFVWIGLLFIWGIVTANLIVYGIRNSESKSERFSKGLLVSRTISERFVSNVFWAGNDEAAEICYRTDYVYDVPEIVNKTNSSITKFHQLEISSLNYFVLFDRIGSMFLVWIVSLMMDAGVIYYHIKNRPHPKFTLTGCRLFVIMCHALGGAFEILSGICVAFLRSKARLYMIYFMSVFAFIHIVTAMVQTPIVFGTRKVMIPCYQMAIILKIFCWYNLVMHVTEYESVSHETMEDENEIVIVSWFLALELIHHIYVWVRVFIWISTRWNLFRKNQYTVAIVLAGMMTVPAALGAWGNLFFWGYVMVYQLVWRKCIRSKEEQVFYEAELDRNPFFSDLYKDRAVDAMKKIAPGRQFNSDTTGTFSEEFQKLSQREKCSYVFLIFDVDNSGHICALEFKTMLKNWGCPSNDAVSMLKRKGYKDEDIVDCDKFYKDFTDLWMFGIESLAEIARKLDEHTSRSDGKIVPFQKLNGNTLYNRQVAAAVGKMHKHSRVQSTILYPDFNFDEDNETTVEKM